MNAETTIRPRSDDIFVRHNEIHAEKDDAKSATRTISSFDSRTDIVLNLKLDKKKSDATPPALRLPPSDPLDSSVASA